MARKASIADVAKLAGVSRTTVSYVVNNVTDSHISEKTRQRVMEAVRDLDYHPSSVARSLARQRILTLGLVLCLSPDSVSSDAFLPSVIYGITSVTSAAGFRLLVEAMDDINRPDAYISLVREAHIDGMILARARADDQQLPHLRASNFPVVLWGQVEGSDLPFADVDNRLAAKSAVEHLISLGHQRIACITNAPLDYPGSADRLRGYQAALQAHHLPFAEELVRYGELSEGSGFEAMRSLLTLRQRPSAVFVASDVVAWGALRAVRSAGLHVPRDMAVVGFDDIQLSEYVVPSLTTIRVPARDIGATAARMVLDIIQTGHQPPSEILKTELIIRESCGVQRI